MAVFIYAENAAPKTPDDMAALLAYPAALAKAAALPDPPAAQGTVVFLLPRNYSGALDELLNRRGRKQETELLFFYENEKQREAAELCARRYGQRGGCHASCFKA
jgi:hypothetical protein